MRVIRAGQRSATRINPPHIVHRRPLDTVPTTRRSCGWRDRGPSGRTMLLFSKYPGRCPGLRNHAPLALKEAPDSSLAFSIFARRPFRSPGFDPNPVLFFSIIFLRILLVSDGKQGSLRRRISGPTARDSLAQPNGLGLNASNSGGPTVRDPDQSPTYRSS